MDYQDKYLKYNVMCSIYGLLLITQSIMSCGISSTGLKIKKHIGKNGHLACFVHQLTNGGKLAQVVYKLF
jgi:hypothetical protein